MRRLLPIALIAPCLLVPAERAAFGREAGPATAFLVLPFENVAEDPSLGWLSTGLALHTAEHMRGEGCAVVDDEDRAVLLEGSGIPAGAPLTLASALELGRKMRSRPVGVRPDRLVLGRFNVQEGDLTLSARVIDLATEGAHPWISRQGRLKDLIEVHTSLAQALARDSGAHAQGHTARNRGKDSDPPLLAFETYCRGMAETDSKKRLALLRQALQEYPGYPVAAYQAATLLARGEKWDEAAETLKKATSDAHPYEAEFHLLSAMVALQRQDPPGAAEEARRSLEYSESARAHVALGRARLAQGDRDAARYELDKAQALDPAEPDLEDLRRLLKREAQAGGQKP
ncbi:MAG TPA: tetratricopeptide repeat protein [Candidatus Cryosericum sp.]|nr:tetratricopeptide repeat protein [Candidatus Cryosericum sp.]